MRIDACIWQFGLDYPGALGNDAQLPISSVSLKAWDAEFWMSTFDRHPAAINGPSRIARLVQTYRQQGIDLLLWCVPKGRNVAGMVEKSLACLDVPGVKGLIWDVEPFSGFCAGDCAYLAQNLARRVRELRPNAWLGAHYDPRPQHATPSALPDWLKHLDCALPMVYWLSFAGQGVWSQPDTAVRQAAIDLRARGFRGEFMPILQGNAPANEIMIGVEAARAAGSTRVSLWRRGVVQMEAWQAMARLQPGAEPPAPPPEPPPEEGLTVGQYEELKKEIAALRSWAQVKVHDAIVVRLAALEKRVATLEKKPVPAPSPTPQKWDTIRRNDTASGLAARNGLTWTAFVALNPQGPPSGNWHLVYPGEKYRVR